MKLKFLKTSNSLEPRLTTKAFQPSLLRNFKFMNRDTHVFTFILCGILLMMICYSLAVFAWKKNTIPSAVRAKAELLKEFQGWIREQGIETEWPN